MSTLFLLSSFVCHVWRYVGGLPCSCWFPSAIRPWSECSECSSELRLAWSVLHNAAVLRTRDQGERARISASRRPQ
ncbi:hypothetical protein EDB84DRAFT_1500905 [Lactarius hengduanensis]|nr:hypothetical protein EDB84DRAFT_1500905 [Lactarius hengduanensis]